VGDWGQRLEDVLFSIYNKYTEEALRRIYDFSTTGRSTVREGGPAYAWSSPSIDMYETEHEVMVKAALPGIKAEEVQINVTNNLLTIRGETKQEEEKQDKSWHIREHRWGAFERSIRLPSGVIADKARADFDNGILTITLSKSDEVKPKTITVKAK
jgi:HSP20 family protein